jgi:hypothetical protein
MNTEQLLWRLFALLILVSIAFVGVLFAPGLLSGAEQAESGDQLSITCSSSGVSEIDYNSSYRPDLTLENQSRISSTRVVDGEGFNVQVTTVGPVVDAVVKGPAGDELLVTHETNETMIAQPNKKPFRLVIDSVSNGTVYRTELEVCPSQTE